jgi:nitrite reductase (NADH) large subunit
MKIVIIGNGVAGINAAKLLSENDKNLKTEVYTQEKYHYYQRPRLIELLAGQVKLEDIYVYPEKWYKKNNIKVFLNSKVIKISSTQKEIELENKTKVNFDKLLIATGGIPFIPPIKGNDRKGIFTLSWVEDIFAIKKYAEKIKGAMVIGGGLLGLESARALASLGLEVTVIEFFPYLLSRQLDPEGGEILKSEIERIGIKVFLNSKTKEILGDKKVAGVMLEDGTTIDGELVLLAAGARPNKNLAEEAGLSTNKGILVDEHMRTSYPDIFAAGDAAEFKGSCYGIIPAALDQSKVAAFNVLEDTSIVYRGTIPSTTLKIIGIDLVSIGEINPQKEDYQAVVRKHPEKCIYKKLVLKEGKIVGGIFLGDKKDAFVFKKMIDQKIDVSRFVDKLLDENFDLKKLF